MDVADLFYFFSAWRGRRGSPRRQEGGGGSFFFENPRRARGFQDGEGGAEGQGGCLRRTGEFLGGALFFCRAQNVHQEKYTPKVFSALKT